MNTIDAKKRVTTPPKFKRHFIPGNQRFGGALFEPAADLAQIRRLSYREHTMNAVSKSQLSKTIQEPPTRSRDGIVRPGKKHDRTDLVIEKLRARRQLSPLVRERESLRHKLDAQHNKVADSNSYSR